MNVRTATRTAAIGEQTRPDAAQLDGSPGRVPSAPALPPPKRRRRPLLLAAGVVLVVLGAVGAYGLASSSSHRVGVVALAADVPWGRPITQADLVEAQIATDPVLHPLAWAERGSAIGKLAAADLHAGSLLTIDDLMAGPIPADGQALVGVAVKPGQLPVTELAARQQIWITRADRDNQNAAPPTGAVESPIRAVVFTVGAADASGGRTVDVLVDGADAVTVADWSAAGVGSFIVIAGRCPP
jgi:hypothetical protein